ncbi:MAG: gamma-glutamylcyclotransferase [Planctomycetes bacterium]|nr:gamma-glutamylcyclotransferase [Planctomycetota bacterium]
MNDQWYFTYGSSLATDQKKNRTGFIREVKRARLDGYRLAFNKRGSDGSGKANIVAEPGETVWCTVFRCSPDALREMDKHEGVAGGHYSRTAVRVRGDGDEALDAVAYVAGTAFLDNSLSPSHEYLQTILRGAREHHLPDDYISRVQAVASQSDSADR